MPIVEATGYAQAASPRRSNPAWAKALQEAVAHALKQCDENGITDPLIIQAHINAARATTKDAWDKLAAEAIRLRTEREARERANRIGSSSSQNT